MYYVIRGRALIVTLGGGDKSSQKVDIKTAKARAELLEDQVMTERIKISNLPEFDPAQYLRTEEDTATYLTSIIEENDAGLLAAALGDIARARGMAEIASSAGLTREALYKALRPGAQPRFETIARVCAAMGMRLTVEPVQR